MFIDRRHSVSILLLVCILISCVFLGCEWIPTETITTTLVNKVAVATISPIEGSDVIGTATFTEVEGGVQVRIEIQNASPGLHATHLHLGSCDDIGSHWHPIGTPAGIAGVSVAEATLEKPPIGIGEIGNIPVNEDGTGVLEFTTPFWSIGGALSTDILGKLILIHETGDTFQTNPHAHNTVMPGSGMHTHNVVQMPTDMEITQATHVCTLAVLGQQVDLNADHHLPGEAVNPHSHDLMEILLKCFLRPEQLIDPATLTTIPFKGSSEHKAFLEIEPKTLAAYHDFFISLGMPVDPNFFTDQYQQTFSNGTPEEFEQEMRQLLSDLYVNSGIDFQNPADSSSYNLLITRFLDERTTAWMLGHFQGDDALFSEWIVEVLSAVQVRHGGGARIACGVIELIE